MSLSVEIWSLTRDMLHESRNELISHSVRYDAMQIVLMRESLLQLPATLNGSPKEFATVSNRSTFLAAESLSYCFESFVTKVVMASFVFSSAGMFLLHYSSTVLFLAVAGPLSPSSGFLSVLFCMLAMSTVLNISFRDVCGLAPLFGAGKLSCCGAVPAFAAVSCSVNVFTCCKSASTVDLDFELLFIESKTFSASAL